MSRNYEDNEEALNRVWNKFLQPSEHQRKGIEKQIDLILVTPPRLAEGTSTATQVAGFNNRLPQFEAKESCRRGFVYLIQSSDGKYKIGRTKNVYRRLHTLQTSHHQKLSLILSIETSNANALEDICQKRFQEKRVHLEWFELTDADVEWMRNLPKT